MIINRLLVLLLLLYIEQLVIVNGINHLCVIIKLFYIHIIQYIYIQPSMNMDHHPTTLAHPSSPISHGPGRLAQSGMILSCSS
jgi:hypothetical protein